MNEHGFRRLHEARAIVPRICDGGCRVSHTQHSIAHRLIYSRSSRALSCELHISMGTRFPSCLQGSLSHLRAAPLLPLTRFASSWIGMSSSGHGYHDSGL